MRPIDASKLLFEIQVCSWDSERDKDMAEDLVLGMPTLTPPNEWVSVKDAMPPEHEPVMCIVSGSPKLGIILDEACQFSSWNKEDGWIIDEYLEWTDADVLWWRMLPELPERRPPEGEEDT